MIEQCVLSANSHWRASWCHVPEGFLRVEKTALYKDDATQSVRITINKEDGKDVYCICSNCGDKLELFIFANGLRLRPKAWQLYVHIQEIRAHFIWAISCMSKLKHGL